MIKDMICGVVGLVSVVALGADIPIRYLAYVEATGSQYVDTKFVPNGNTKIEATYQLVQLGQELNYVFGEYGNNGRCQFSRAAATFAGFGSSYKGDIAWTEDTDWHTVVMDKGTFTVDSEQIYMASFTGTAKNLFLFAVNANGKADNFATIRISSVKIWENGVPKRLMVPCQMSDGRIGFWDFVTGSFCGDAAGGAFAGGGTVPSPLERLEYVRFADKTYVDTGIVPSDHETVIRFRDEKSAPGGYLFGGSNNNQWQYAMWSDSVSWVWGYGGTGTRNSGMYAANVDHTVVYNDAEDGSVYLDGFRLGKAVDVTPTSSLFLGRRYNVYNYEGRIYCVKVTERSTGNLALWLEPMQIGGVVGLYDPNLGKLLVPGSGSLTAGPALGGVLEVACRDGIEIAGMSPACGRLENLGVGEEIAVSVPAVTLLGPQLQATVTGWKLYEWSDAEMDWFYDENRANASGTGASFTYVHTGVATKLEWQMSFANPVAAGDERYVTEFGDDAADGKSWATAKKSVQVAIDAAPDNGKVLVAPGVYHATNTEVVADSVVYAVNLARPVALIGVAGPERTTIDAGTEVKRGELRMTDGGAVAAGLTFCNGSSNAKGRYAGVYATAGLLSNCVVSVRGLHAKPMLELGGTAKAYGITVPSFVNNEANRLLYAYGNAVIDRVTTPRGGAINNSSYGYLYLEGNAILRNTSVLGTTVNAGSTVQLKGNARLEHATIAGIRTSNDSSAIRVDSSTAVVTNCIIYCNTADVATYADIYNNANAARFFDCCCAQLTAGANGNITEDPQFSDPENGDYSLKPLSKCVNHATTPATDDPLAGTLDVAGNPRVFGKSLDIGAFECQVDPATGPLDAAFDPSVTTSAAGESLTTTFSAYAVGKTDGLTAVWNFGDGTTSADWPSVTHLYEVPGRYTVTLTVTTATETKTYAIADCITVIPRKTFVSKTGSCTYPYDNWEKATTDLEVALQTRCAEVEVGDGTFENTVSEHLITWPVYVHSTNGKTNTTLKAKNANPARHFRVLKDGAGTRISGFTLLGGGSGSQNWHGGLHLEAGQVDHCTITNCTRVGRNSVCYLTGDARMEDCAADFGDISTWWDGTQTGFLLEGKGVVDRCRIARWKGTAGTWHCAVLLNSADTVLRNSLVTGCEGGSSLSDGARSSAVCIGDNGGKVENCTITGNSCAGHGAGLYASKAVGSVVNTIIWGNTALADHDDIYAASLPSNNVRNCCFSNPYLPKGYEPNCTLADPNFDAENPAHLTVYSQKQIDAGETSSWAEESGAADLDGNPRLVNDAVDMGCFEYQGGGHVDLDGTIDIAVPSGRVPFDATFEANLVGDDTGLTGTWDFGDGTKVPYASLKQAHRYVESGLYTVTLAVENAGGEAKTIVCGKVVTVVPQVCYVSTNGLSVSPYDTWAKAATNVADVLELNPKTVLVSNGVYTLTKAISLITDLELKSVNGPSVTTFDGDDKYRLINLQGDGAVVDGFTLVNGRGGSPNALLATKGTLRNCVLTSPGHNTYDRWVEIYGAAVVEDCLFTDWSNSNGNADYWDLMGIYLYGDALMDRCEISQFRGDQSANGVRAMLSVYGNAILRNSIVHDCCFSQGNNEITFVRMEDKARIENCTFANNSITATGGKVRRAVNLKSGSVVNTVFVGNTVEGIEHDLSIAGGTVTHSRSVDLTDGVDGNITADPRLRNPAKGDYRLRPNSPCVNAGVFAPWMTGATDCLGNPRVFNLKVDMGACENQSGGLVLMVK